MSKLTVPFLALLALVTAPIASAQTLDEVLPPVADPGDQVRLVGTNLGSVDRVRFTAVVGGFVGQWTIQVAPDAVSANEILVTVPQFNAFAPADATPPGSVFGSITASAGGTTSNAVEFGYLEATFGAVTTEGQGGSDPVGSEPRIGFALSGGVPASGNLTFRPVVSDALPNAVPILAIGAQGTLPYPVVAGGELLIDPFLPVTYLFAAPSLPQPTDRYEALVPIPGTIGGITVVMQFVTIDPVTFAASLSDALVVEL